MKKNLLLFICLSLSFILNAQNIDKATALKIVTGNSAAIGLSAEDLKNVFVSDAYIDHTAATEMIYLQQSYKGLPVFNQLQVLAFKNGKLVSNAGGRIAGIEKITRHQNTNASITAEQAVRTAMAAKYISTNQNVFGYPDQTGRKFNFGKLGIAYEDVTAELMWVPLNDGKKIRLAWQVYLVPTTSSDYWMIRVDAASNKVIDENNLTVYCNWDDKHDGAYTNNFVTYKENQQATSKLPINNLFDFNSSNIGQQTSVSPLIVNSASYRVIPYPAESPRHAGGTPALRTDPWTLAPGNATTLKWHSNGTNDYTITRSNNAWAKEDHASNNSTSGQPATSTTTPDPLTFDFPPNFYEQPNQTTPVPNRQFNITNLFYWLNTYHDILYQYGFDEPSGNFQSNNQGRGGQGGDFVFGDAQDGNFGAGNQNNANFSTPVDGQSGRMQMYLWDTAAICLINSPASLAGPITAIESGFSTQNKLIDHGPITGDVVLYNDNSAGTTHEACGAPANSIAGKIALIDRGTCTFVIKVKNAQLAGAIGVIVTNNVDGMLTMAGNDNTITIPAVFISQDDGIFIKAQLAAGVNVTLGAANVDGDVDNGVVVHEHSHGLSNRLTGGPSNSSCLGNAEHMGEGWSDYYSLMLTQNWATSNLNTGFSTARSIGTYVIGQVPSGNGIRTLKYSTDFVVNNLVYAASIDPESHNRGELWCATLWDMTWNIINQVGIISPDLYNGTATGGNVIAMRIVTEGMKLQPCGPGFITGRDAIIQADQVLYNGAHICAIKEAFRRRGMGDNASQGSANSVTDQTADFAPINCANCTNVGVTTQPAATIACTGSNASFTVVIDGTTPTYQWQVSTNGGTTYTDLPGQTTAILTLTNVAAGMNGNLYQVIVSNACPSTITSTAVLLTVNDPANITAQPANATTCAGTNANFSVTATGTANSYQWQVSTDGGTTFTDIAGATAATLALTGVTGAMNGYQYHVVISSCGPAGITSTNVTLNVNTPATISAQPASTNACSGGGDATFTVTATGGAVTYQWQVSTNGGGTFTDIPGATTATLTVTGITSAMNNNQYQVIITNPCTGAVTSSQATLTVSDPAAITTQPAAATICAGSNTSFTIVTAGTGVTYQWQVSTDGGTSFSDVPGATAATLNLAAVTVSMNTNQYHVLVFSCSPTGLSSTNVTLTVNSPVSITAQPQSANACVGGSATFTTTADGTANTYQWQVSTDGGATFTDIPGATAATLTLTGATLSMDNNVYHVNISNTCTPAGVASSNSTLTVSNAASITTQPVNNTVCEGANAVITANASGASYQWQVSTDGGTTFTDVPGATTTTLTLTGVTSAMNNNQYQLVIASCGGNSLNSDQVTLSVNSQATISDQPSNTIVCTGTDATFTVNAGGTTPTTYQWQVSTDGGTTYTNITGATSATLTLTAVTDIMNNNLYQVIVSNICTPGLASNAGTLTVNPATSITTDPANATACEGSSTSFTVQAANATGATYQWQVSTDGGTTFSDITGANSATLSIAAVTNTMNNNSYHVLISACGSLTSANAVLLVNPSPVVAITASPYQNITANLTTTLTATSTPPSASFNWFKDGMLVPSATTNTLVVAYTELGEYTASVTDANGCTGNSSRLVIGDSVINHAFIFPNPNNGHFWVTFAGTQYNGKPRYITMYDGKGAKVYQKAFVTIQSYDKMEVNVEGLSKGVYALILSDTEGGILGTGKVLIQ